MLVSNVTTPECSVFDGALHVSKPNGGNPRWPNKSIRQQLVHGQPSWATLGPLVIRIIHGGQYNHLDFSIGEIARKFHKAGFATVRCFLTPSLIDWWNDWCWLMASAFP